MNWQTMRKEKQAQVEKFYQENRNTVQLVGIVTLAGATGTVAGLLLGKGLLAAKEVAAAKGVAVANASSTVHAAGLLDPVSTATALSGTVSLLNNVVSNGAMIVDKMSLLFTGAPGMALSLTAGAVGGGAIGVGLSQRQVRAIQEQLNAQRAYAEATQAEKARIQAELRNREANLNDLQSKLATQVPTQPDRLEDIRGIGKVLAQRLNAAGVYTFADLAAQTPEQLRTIIGTARNAPLMNLEEWITEARQRVADE